MIQTIKKYTYISIAGAVLFVLPYVIGWMTIMDLKIQPINLNKPLTWAQGISIAIMLFFTFQAIRVINREGYGRESEVVEDDFDKMYVSNHHTGEITWGNITPEVIKSIIDSINQDRYTLSWYQLEEIKKQHKETKQIVLHINNLQRPWVRNHFDKDMSLNELGYPLS